MPLPKCVKTLERSDALEADGWRHVGTLLTFEGAKDRVFHGGVVIAEPKDVLGLAKEIEWSGRLWRDPQVGRRTALDETLRHIEEFYGTIYAIGNGPAAFGMFKGPCVVLIGTHPAACGLGLASKLIRRAIGGKIVAGTYADNAAAIALYESLDMKQIHRQEVYHK